MTRFVADQHQQGEAQFACSENPALALMSASERATAAKGTAKVATEVAAPIAPTACSKNCLYRNSATAHFSQFMNPHFISSRYI